MISANTSSRSISKSPTIFIWKQSGDVLRARAQVPSRACCGQKKASENQQKQPRRSQMLASVAHQCLQKFGSLQKAASEIWAKCLQSANVAFFLLAGIQGKKFAKKENPPVFRAGCGLQHLALKTGKFPKNGDPGAIRTRDVPLRRTKDCSPLRAFECPGMPYFTGLLTNVGVRISLEYTPQIPGCR